MNKRKGSQTVVFQNPVSILSAAAISGPKEGEGPLARYIDVIMPDVLCGQDSWEKAESILVKDGLELAVKKSGLTMDQIHYIIAGDLLNQNIGSTFGLRDTQRPFFGIFGACSTMGEGMSLGAMIIDGGFADYVAASASSHFCAAEKQFRYPLELGTQRPPTSSWTVTGDGSVVLAAKGGPPYIKAVTTGKITDLGISDVNNMGAAMAPAAADTILNHFSDMGINPDYYDVIATGDLGHIGRQLVVDLCAKEGLYIGPNYTDCGIEIFDKEKQDTHAGGSGCACSAITFCGYFYTKLKRKEINRLLFIPTGSLHSPISAQQSESIPGIAHAVVIESE